MGKETKKGVGGEWQGTKTLGQEAQDTTCSGNGGT